MGALGCQATSQIANPGEKIRYAAEFFDELFPGKKVVKRQKKFTSALKQLQDGLGDLNDIAVDERLIASVAPHNDAFATDCIQVRKE
jgi:triphosphatase